MVNSFDDETKDNMKKMLYVNEERIKAYNIGRNNWSIGATPPITRDSNPLYDNIYNTRAHDIQMEPIFDTYNAKGDPMAHIKAFKMNFKTKIQGEW